MGFPIKWVEWIKGCLSSGSGSVIVNGSPTKEFKFKRGLRQGDPLSPFLFIIAMEIINMLMKRASNLGLFHGCQIPNGGPNITHLCYADDVLFFGEWSQHNILALNRLLRWLNLLSGLKVNRQKSKLFGIGVDDAEVARLAQVVSCDVGSLPFTHLGIPIGVNMKRAKCWKPVLEKFSARLSKWKAAHLSFAGRLTLIKSVLGSLPSYFLSLFAAPKGVINKLEKIRRDFLWGKTSAGRKLRWMRWSLLLKSKKYGGLGVGSIRDFNLAMLAKWWWRFKENPNQLWAIVVDAIHKGRASNGNPPFIPVKKTLPGVWKDVASVDGSLAKNGINIKENLVLDGNKWVWRSDPDGSFSVKHIRSELDRAGGGIDSFGSSFFWNTWAPPKANFLLWRACLGKVAAKVSLINRGVLLADAFCPRCGMEEEDSEHIFVKCLWSKCIWWNIVTWMRVSYPADIQDLRTLVDYLKSQPGCKSWKRIVYSIVMGTVWRIWIARNEKTFNNKFIPISRTVDMIKEDVFLWIKNRSNRPSPGWEKWKTFDIIEML
ncbi:uncharacterized protein LOC110931338 [Helianthus annuus]|uniref:uncharacterized protein LOC110931338 n=1 Tax=Helianthus annuus TaxID=4232 RepID=UPI000B8F717C|nr:uncharacterized protein LOC110931338 [Helianthus annuus]